MDGVQDVGGGGGDGLDFAELVPVAEQEIGGTRVLAVDARQVWTVLGSGRQFTNWMSDQIEKCKLVQGVDCEEQVFNSDVKNPAGGRPRRTFVLTLRAAKHVGMVDTGMVGAQLREYFLDCEARLAAIQGGSADVSEGSRVGVGGDDASDARARAREAMVEDDRLDRFQLCTATQPLTMREFLVLRKVPADVIGQMRREAEADLMEHAVMRPVIGGFFRHAVTGRWVFRREVLEAWWHREGRQWAMAKRLE